jgi:hypothetical protein
VRTCVCVQSISVRCVSRLQQRMRYYYAIAVCDSVETARAVVEYCGGLEIEATANRTALRARVCVCVCI